MTLLEGVCCGVFGGVAVELLAIYNVRKEFAVNPPLWAKSLIYWMVTVVMIFVSGGVVCVYVMSGVNINYIMAVHLGASTPLILTSMLQSKPIID